MAEAQTVNGLVAAVVVVMCVLLSLWALSDREGGTRPSPANEQAPVARHIAESADMQTVKAFCDGLKAYGYDLMFVIFKMQYYDGGPAPADDVYREFMARCDIP